MDRHDLLNYRSKCREFWQISIRILYESTVDANTIKRPSVYEQRQLLLLAVSCFTRSLEIRSDTFRRGRNAQVEWHKDPKIIKPGLQTLCVTVYNALGGSEE